MVVGFAVAARGEVTLPHVFSSNMVLQRDRPVPVWGWAQPGEKVTVEFGQQEKWATADASGAWSVRLGALAASADPANLTIAGSNRLVLTNVLVGEVWLCSGQSNMEKPIGEQRSQKPTRNWQAELQSGDQFPLIRLFKVEKKMSPEPLRDVTGAWSACSSNALERMKFSAVAYFFARDVQREIRVPIGLIESAWGGTRIEPWTPPAGFAAVPKVAHLLQPLDANQKLSNTVPAVLYNGMIAPLVPFAFRGALWYQGESNCMDQPDGMIYADKMEALIRGWRTVWGQGDFPFYYVQLAPYHYYYERQPPRVPRPDALPEIWEAQTAALRVKDTGMVVITDLVEDLKDIHPTQKLEVGQRLARLALARTYGKQALEWSGPTYRKLSIKGSQAVVSFSHAEGGLVSKNGQAPTWFTVAGADGEFVPADAVIQDDTVVVSSSAVPAPAAVRFAWHEAAQPNLFNRAGLPAAPFRTDAPPAAP
jgi:sialate O-acetylesterase